MTILVLVSEKHVLKSREKLSGESNSNCAVSKLKYQQFVTSRELKKIVVNLNIYSI